MKRKMFKETVINRSCISLPLAFQLQEPLKEKAKSRSGLVKDPYVQKPVCFLKCITWSNKIYYLSQKLFFYTPKISELQQLRK